MPHDMIGRPMEILLVEDSLADARLTIDSLKQSDVPCRVTLVRDGEEALEFLRQSGIFARAPRPDLVLLDMELPRKDGREVLSEIRADDELHPMLVVVLTASAVHKAVLDAQHLHVDAFMTKPVSLEQFLDVVRSLRKSLLAEVILPPME